MRRISAGACCALVALAIAPSAALGSIDVTTTADELDTGAPPSTGCSLREAISSANSGTAIGGCFSGAAGLDLITLDPGAIYVRALTGPGEESNATGDLDITDPVTISVPGGSAVIAGSGASSGDRVLDIGAAATISNVEIAGGTTTAAGGGITVRSGASLFLLDSTVASNTAGGFGGGINNFGSLVELHNVTISGNASVGDGGGMDSSANSSRIRLYHSTVTGNNAGVGAGPGNGGGISAFAGEVELRNSVLAGNADVSPATSAPECRKAPAANFFSDGGSVIGQTTGCDVAVSPSDDINVTGPGLGPLASNGGGTRTHALLAGSPAIDNGLPAFCEPLDQRGVARSGACDSGAFEFVPPNPIAGPPPSTGTPTPASPKTCPKGKKLKKGKCVKKKRKKRKKARK